MTTPQIVTPCCLGDKITDMEQWRKVSGFDSYSVSSQGRVRSSFGNRVRLLKPQIDRIGRRRVMLYGVQGPKWRMVHVLVLEAFVGKRPRGKLGLHGPGGARNNSVGNVYWGTYSDNNNRDRHRDGTALLGQDLKWTKLGKRQVLWARRALADGVTPLEIASRLKITRRNVYAIKNRQTWKWL